MHPQIIIASLALLLCASAQGAQIPLGAQQAANLGVQTGTVHASREITLASAHARVTLPPGAETLIGPLFAGNVAALHVAGGETVSPGQPLAQISSPDFLALQRDFIDTQSAHTLAQAELQRTQELHGDGIVSLRRLQQAQAEVLRRTVGLNVQRGLLRSAGMNDADIDSLARSGALAATLTLKTPAAGVVLDVSAGVGAHIDAMEPLLRVADLREKWLLIALPVRDMHSIGEGHQLRLEAPLAEVQGEVINVGSHVDTATQTVAVRARVSAGADLLAPGQFVEVQFSNVQANPVWQVPATALVRQGENCWLFIAVPGGFNVLPVHLHGQPDRNAHISGNINAQTRIATSGTAALRALWPQDGEVER